MRRTLTPELMDDPNLDPAEHARALAGLARLNVIAGSDRILWPEVRAVAREAGGRVSVLDIATGSGDVVLALARRAGRAGISLELHACDISQTALDEAGLRAKAAGVELGLWRHDAVADPFDRRFDIVICSLFLHHLDTGQAERFLRHAAGAAERELLVSDLRRDPLGLFAAWASSRLLTRSRIVHVDAVKSVRAAYRMCEALEIARRAGLDGAKVSARWPRRMLLQWRPDRPTSP